LKKKQEACQELEVGCAWVQVKVCDGRRKGHFGKKGVLKCGVSRSNLQNSRGKKG